MSFYLTDQSLGWRLTESPQYENELEIGIRSARKDRAYAFWESHRMAFSPPVIGLEERSFAIPSTGDFRIIRTNEIRAIRNGNRRIVRNG